MSNISDNKMNIDTQGWIFWDNKNDHHYHESEPTDYRSLEALFDVYQPPSNSHFIDIGAGKGRVLFYISHRFNIPATGIELHPETYQFLNQNLREYRKNFPESQIDITFVAAEKFEFQAEQNIVYMFNPFSPEIFRKVMKNLQQSLIQNPRTLDLILYYPLPAIRRIIDEETPFELFKVVDLPWFPDNTDRFDIFRYNPPI